MNCKPVYLKNDPYRIAYVANGQWQLQKTDNSQGTRERDPWQPVMRPTTFAEAKTALNAKDSQRPGTLAN